MSGGWGGVGGGRGILEYEIIIIIMEICKAPTLRLRALNKRAHIMYIEMENVIKKEKERKEVYTPRSDLTKGNLRPHYCYCK